MVGVSLRRFEKLGDEGDAGVRFSRFDVSTGGGTVQPCRGGVGDANTCTADSCKNAGNEMI